MKIAARDVKLFSEAIGLILVLLALFPQLFKEDIIDERRDTQLYCLEEKLDRIYEQIGGIHVKSKYVDIKGVHDFSFDHWKYAEEPKLNIYENWIRWPNIVQYAMFIIGSIFMIYSKWPETVKA